MIFNWNFEICCCWHLQAGLPCNQTIFTRYLTYSINCKKIARFKAGLICLIKKIALKTQKIVKLVYIILVMILIKLLIEQSLYSEQCCPTKVPGTFLFWPVFGCCTHKWLLKHTMSNKACRHIIKLLFGMKVHRGKLGFCWYFALAKGSSEWERLRNSDLEH